MSATGADGGPGSATSAERTTPPWVGLAAAGTITAGTVLFLLYQTGGSEVHNVLGACAQTGLSPADCACLQDELAATLAAADYDALVAVVNGIAEPSPAAAGRIAKAVEAAAEFCRVR